MNEFLNHFHFLRPEWLLLAPVLLLLERLLRTGGRSGDPFAGIIEPTLLDHLRLKRPRSAWLNPGSALALLFALVTLILAGPSWRQQPSPLAEDAAPLVLIIDVSESMNTKDIAPSRLERARQKMSDLLALAPDKRVGIVVYAGSAHTVLPLTGDHDIARSYLHGLDTSLAPRPGKFPEYALPSVDRLLANTHYQASLLLVTDGLGSASPELISAWCRQSPNQLLIYGIGNPDPEQTDMPLDRLGLSKVADTCNGDYVEVSIDNRDVEAIAGKLTDTYLIIDDEALPWLDGGYPLVFPAMALAMLWFRRGWTRVWQWLAIPLLTTLSLSGPQPAMAQVARDKNLIESSSIEITDQSGWLEKAADGFVGLWLTPDQYGRILLELGYYDKAARVFNNPVWQATAHYYAEDFRQSATLFTRKDSDAALFNEANAHAHRRDYVRAVRRYEALLARSPDFPGAENNRAFVQKIIDDINRLSESQAQEAGVGSEDIDPEHDPQIGDGADDLTFEQQERQQYSAEEILSSPETAELWLKNVQQNPANFLRTKFSIQLEERGVSEQ